MRSFSILPPTLMPPFWETLLSVWVSHSHSPLLLSSNPDHSSSFSLTCSRRTYSWGGGQPTRGCASRGGRRDGVGIGSGVGLREGVGRRGEVGPRREGGPRSEVDLGRKGLRVEEGPRTEVDLMGVVSETSSS